MGVCRNCFGQLAYTATVKRSEKLTDVYAIHSGDNRIMKCEPYRVSEAVIADPVMMWEELPKFESITQAAAFLKAHKAELL